LTFSPTNRTLKQRELPFAPSTVRLQQAEQIQQKYAKQQQFDKQKSQKSRGQQINVSNSIVNFLANPQQQQLQQNQLRQRTPTIVNGEFQADMLSLDSVGAVDEYIENDIDAEMDTTTSSSNVSSSNQARRGGSGSEVADDDVLVLEDKSAMKSPAKSPSKSLSMNNNSMASNRSNVSSTSVGGAAFVNSSSHRKDWLMPSSPHQKILTCKLQCLITFPLCSC
jgi:hypothetical protein